MTSDLFIPRLSDILDRALDCRDSAVRLKDAAAVRQLDRLIANLPGATLCWQLGTLHIGSPSGHSYQVTRAGCSCPNGTKSHKRQCYHIALFELLLDMLDTECETRDLAALVPPDTAPGEDLPDDIPPNPGRRLGARLAFARTQLAWGVR